MNTSQGLRDPSEQTELERELQAEDTDYDAGAHPGNLYDPRDFGGAD